MIRDHRGDGTAARVVSISAPARAGGVGRHPGPFVECAEERIRILVTEQERDLTVGQVRAIEVMPRELLADFRQQGLDVRAFVAEPPLQRPLADRKRLCDAVRGGWGLTSRGSVTARADSSVQVASRASFTKNPSSAATIVPGGGMSRSRKSTARVSASASCDTRNRTGPISGLNWPMRRSAISRFGLHNAANSGGSCRCPFAARSRSSPTSRTD